MCYIMGCIVKKTKRHTFHRIRRSTTLKLCSLHFNLLTRIIVFINPRMVILMRTNTAYSDADTWENKRLFAIICYILWTMCKAVCIWTACIDCARSPNMCCSLRVCADKHPLSRMDRGEKRAFERIPLMFLLTPAHEEWLHLQVVLLKLKFVCQTCLNIWGFKNQTRSL